MKIVKKLWGSVAILLFAVTQLYAEQINIEMVSVADPGNISDTRTYYNWQLIEYGDLTFGTVGYNYSIGKYEVTNAQYTTFLNSVAKTDTYGLYNTSMGTSSHGGIIQSGVQGNFSYTIKSGYDLKPVVFASWYNALRFVNWLNNGQVSGLQGAGTTESGAYTMYTNGITTTGASARQSDAVYWLPSEDEWYKAAYYDPTLNSGDGGYWLHAIQSDTMTTEFANYSNSVGTVSEVGSYEFSSYYGTYDQGGNVFEWNDSDSGVARGGSWSGLHGPALLAASFRHDLYTPPEANYNNGFRIAGLYGEEEENNPDVIPEPLSMCLLMTALGGLVLRKIKRA